MTHVAWSATDLPRLMLVTDRHVTAGRDLVDVVEDACDGGLRFIQVRERDLPADALQELVADLLTVVPPDTRIVINGRPELAVEMHCGVHLSSAAPMPDIPMPPLWGRAVHDEVEARAALDAGTKYLVLGTIYPTPSKPDFAGVGVAAIPPIVRLAGGVPVFVIGGVELATVPDVRGAGAYGIAVRRAVLEAKNPAAAVRKLNEALAR